MAATSSARVVSHPPHSLGDQHRSDGANGAVEPVAEGGVLMTQQETRARLHQRHRSTCDHVCHHLVWHLDQQRALAQGILAFFRQREALDLQYAAALKALPPVPVPSGASAAMRAALLAVSEVPAKTADGLTNVAQALAAGPHKKMTELLGSMDATNRVVKSQMAKALQSLSNSFQDVQSLHVALQKGVAGAVHREDPYTIALKIKKAVHAMSSVEDEATSALRTLLRDVRQIHHRNVESLKLILFEYHTCLHIAAAQQQKDVDVVSAALREIDTSDYNATVVELYQSVANQELLPGDDTDEKVIEALQRSSKATHVPFQYDLQTLVKRQGILQRKTAFLGRWKPQLFVLSKYGFLHYFGPDLLVPEATYQLSKCRVEAGGESDTFILVEVNMLMHSRLTLRCPVKEDLLHWVADLRDFCRKL
eukprot:GGOE01000951.1.p1 GENE.GGOE01000951.1~~GGOE01000951.1.p1  ORF type:complete len:456 (+),score=121.70 GGOE01000951.1:101-1369(+)